MVVVALFPILSRMLSSYQLCFVVIVVAQLGESLYHSTDEEHSLDVFSSESRCGWDCIITNYKTNFSRECHDPVFTKKRLINFNVIYDLFVNTKCLNQTSYKTFGNFTDDFSVWIPSNNTLSSFLYFIKAVYSLLFYKWGVSTEVTYCVACENKSNPGGACLFVDLPLRILNHIKAQPLILAKCWSLFVRELQIYFLKIFLLWKGYTRWVIRVSLVLLLLPTFPVAFILSLLESLVIFFVLFCATTPHIVFLSSSWPACLSKLYKSSLFVRLPALKISVQFTNFCVLWLEHFGGFCLLLSAFWGVLLTLLLSFNMLL